MKPVTDPAVLAQLNGGGLQPVTDPAVLAQLNGSAAPPTTAPAPQQLGEQPSAIDRIVASPIGRGIHDIVGGTVRGVADTASMMPLLSGIKPGVDMVANAVNGRYEASLARNRNTPGYAAARASADGATAARGSGFTDQMLAPFLPTMAGAMGATGGFDAMNANADSQQQGQDTFAAAHPVLSTIARVGGGFLAGPSLANVRIPAAIPKVPAIKPMAAEAHKAGYVLTPRMISAKPGIVADAMAGWSGKIKTAQGASEKNQAVTNALGATDLGLPRDTVLTDNVFRNVRKEAGKAYEAIPQALPVVTVDKEFLDGVSTLGGANSAAASEFPDIMRNVEVEKLISGLTGKTEFPSSAGVELVKSLRKRASSNFKAAGDAEKLELAFVQRHAADEIEGLIERNLAVTGDQGLVQSYRNARQLIAKSHDLEAATNTATGNVSARKIGQLANRGRPLSGGMRTIGDTANAFPRAMQSEAAFGETEPLSVLDMGVAAVSAAHGSPGIAGAILGKPLARAALLSGPMQRSMAASATVPRSAAPMLQAPRFTPNSPIPYGLALAMQQRGQ